MVKISWSKALSDYLKDETQSYASIASSYGVSLQAVKKKAGKEKWQGLRQKSIQKVNQRLPELIGESVADINANHAQLGKLLQYVALEAMKENNFKPENLVQALQSIKVGVEIERKALDMDKQNNHKSITDIIEADRQKYGF